MWTLVPVFYHLWDGTEEFLLLTTVKMMHIPVRMVLERGPEALSLTTRGHFKCQVHSGKLCSWVNFPT